MPSAKILKRKQQVVADLAAELREAQSIVLTDYQGLTVAEDTEMREDLRKSGVCYKVAKNEVIKRALKDLGIELDAELLCGPSALAFSKDDVVLAPRLSKKYVEKFKKTKIKGGILEGEPVDLGIISQLASIPEKEVLYGQLVGGLIYPIRSLAVTLNLLAQKAGDGVEKVADLAVAGEAKAEETTETVEEAPVNTEETVEETVQTETTETTEAE